MKPYNPFVNQLYNENIFYNQWKRRFSWHLNEEFKQKTRRSIKWVHKLNLNQNKATILD